MREALGVGAVVIDHVIPLHPFEFGLIDGIQMREWPSVEVSVGSSEGGMSPVSLDQPSSCSPFISIPNARIQPHRLPIGVPHSDSFQILEFSYWCVVHPQSVQFNSFKKQKLHK